LVSGENSEKTTYSGPCIFIYLSVEQARIHVQERRNMRHENDSATSRGCA
jgi:hypothetical protein